MKITDKHTEYTNSLEKWRRCRDFIAGADALRKHDIGCNGDYQVAYLPKLSDRQSSTDYEKYVRRALYDNVVRRMRNSLSGLVFSKEPEVEFDGSIAYMEDDCDLMETPLDEMAGLVLREVLEVGRCGILVDRPSMPDGLSVIDAERLGLRAHFVPYKAEQIVNWSLGRVGSRWMVMRVVLSETDTEYTELQLDKIGYSVTKHTKQEKGGEWIKEPPVYPLMNGQPMQAIPFWFFGSNSGKVTVVDPPLLDMVEDARSWYQSSADLEHARFACGLPTPGFYGFTEDEVANITLGGLNGISSTNENAKAEYLEYQGEGTQPLERALTQKYDMMAKHGVDILDKADAEATDTVRARVGIQTATLSDIANTISRLMSQALQFATKWMGGSGESEIELNTNYIAASINPQEVAALLQAVVQGALPVGDFVKRLRKGGVIEADRTDDDVMADLDGAKEMDTGTL